MHYLTSRSVLIWSLAASLVAGTSLPAQLVYSNNASPGDSFTNATTTNTGQAVGSSGWYYNNVRNSGVVGINTTYSSDADGSVFFSGSVGPAGASSKADIEFLPGAVANGSGNYSPGAALGTLGNLTALSYEWYRASGGTATEWLHPVLRLQVVSPDLSKSGYLVYEGVYNAIGNNPATLDAWVTEDLVASDYRMWSTGSTLPNLNVFYSDDVKLSSWQADYSDYYVIGVSLGIGSGWGTFDGAIDNVSFAFTGGASGDFNFAVVPEPSTYAGILAVLALSFAVWRRHRTA
jgi:hypothetical protein